MSFTTRFESLAAALLLALVAGAMSAAQAWAEEIRLDALKIPAVISGSNGTVTYQLEAIVLRPDDRLPHPLAVLNHGSPRSADARPTMSPYGMWAQTAAVARRGSDRWAGSADTARADTARNVSGYKTRMVG